YHSFTHLAGSRVDIERVLESDLRRSDPDDIVDDFSEPPHFYERLSPVTTTLGEAPIKGRNWTDMMIKCYRMFGKIFARSSGVLHQSLEAAHREGDMAPFMSLSVDPDTLVRLLERDNEAGENSYWKLMELFEAGALAPSVTVPFHVILPLLRNEFDQRLCIRLALQFFRPQLKTYEKYLKIARENQMVVSFWAPETALDASVIQIIQEEFFAFCTREKFAKPHLVLLASAPQANKQALDLVMKHWCALKNGNANKNVSLIFCDPSFSEWMMGSHPSIKKIIDRTIAKVDAGMDERGADYAWAHFEDLETLTYTARGAVNLEQRILKLCELGYLALSPDTFVRRKVMGKFGVDPTEPIPAGLYNNSPATDGQELPAVYSTWRGWSVGKDGVPKIHPATPFERTGAKTNVKCTGSASWKIAWTKTLHTCVESIAGDPGKLQNGVLSILAKLSGQKTKEDQRKAVEQFLLEYGMIYWREHFTQHNLSEADLRIDDMAARALRPGVKKELTPEEIATVGAAAQSYFFLLDAHNSLGMHALNIDQRALYQNAVMLTLSFCMAIAALHYHGQEEKAAELANLLESELLGFANAYERYNLAEFGVDKKDWEKTIASETPDSKLNVVERAARRIAARHLEDFGYNDQFPEDD
ncbi:TPA: hypothetical protein DDW35_12725, partial [Candidatus Sumerlaeota bacterium]|nr:hypothetical protein [Candidatus Sumerlaeota bacterium]